METTLTPAGRLRERIPEAVEDSGAELGTEFVVVRRSSLVEALVFLHAECGFEMLMDLSATDWLPKEPRFHVNYHLLGLDPLRRVRVKVRLPGDDPVVPSCVSVFAGAEVQEREAYDLMGITFTGHPDLRRLLMPDDWLGHPHRKDYPTGGVPVEYKIEPAYVGIEKVSDRGRASAGGIPPRLGRDRGKPSPWTWTGAPASGVRVASEPPERTEAKE